MLQVPSITIVPPTTYTDGTPIGPGDITAYRLEVWRPGGPAFELLDGNRDPANLTFNLVTDYNETAVGAYSVRAQAVAGSQVSAYSANAVRTVQDVQLTPNAPSLT